MATDKENKNMEDYNFMQLAQIKKAGSVEAWKEGLRARASKGGQNSTYTRTPAQRKAASERAKAQWQARKKQG